MAIFDKKKLQKIKDIEKKDKKHTIMIVDDEEKQLTSLENLLSEEYHIITSRDGQEALDKIKAMEQPENISVVIADQRMPKLTGIQLFEQLLTIIPNTIRIILTAYDDKDVIIDSINKAKICEFILKPFEPDELKLKVKGAVETFEIQQELENHRISMEEQIKKLKQKIKKLEKIHKQIIKRRGILNDLKNLIFNPQTLEAKVHKIFEKNPWILGKDYERMSSNETLKRTVEQCLGKKYKGDSGKLRPDLILAEVKKDNYNYLLIEFKKPGHKLDRNDESQAQYYRDELNNHIPNSKIKIMLIGGGINKNISPIYRGVDVEYLSYQGIISSAWNEIKWLVEDLEKQR